jgi:hypothetical protein
MKRHDDVALTPFANDPIRGPHLRLALHHINALNGHHYLSTALLDYLIRAALSNRIPQNVLIGSEKSFSSWKE